MEKFLPANDRYAALLLYSMVFSLAFNGYDAGIMTVILADKQVSPQKNKLGLNSQQPSSLNTTMSTQIELVSLRQYHGQALGWLNCFLAEPLQICLGDFGLFEFRSLSVDVRVWLFGFDRLTGDQLMIIGVVVQVIPNTYGVLILGRLLT